MTAERSSSNHWTKLPSIRDLAGSVSGVLVALVIHLILDRDAFERRLHVYYVAYVSIFFSLLFILLLAHITYTRSSSASTLLRFALVGLVYGFIAGALAYVIAVQLDVFAVRGEKIAFSANLKDGFGAYASTLLVFPLLSLKSWTYGLTAGLVASVTLRIGAAAPP